MNVGSVIKTGTKDIPMTDITSVSMNNIETDGRNEPKSVHRKTRRSFYAALIVLSFISAAVYLNTLQNGFVYDDTWQVLNNNWIRNARYIPDIVTSDVWKFSGESPSNYYRPMMYLIYMIIYHLSGLDPRAFHLLNVLLNVLVCLLVFMSTVKLLQQFLPAKRNIIFPSFAASVLFATHPVHTEAVAWIAAIPELSYSLFCLLSLYLYTWTRETARPVYIMSVSSFFLAAFCKEPALLFPFVLIAYDYCLGKTTGKNLLRIRRYIPYFAAAAIYLAARVLVLGQLVQTVKHNRLDTHVSLVNVFPLFSAYLAKLIWPLNLNAYTVFSPIPSLFTLRGGAAVIVTLAFIVFISVSFKKNGLFFLSLSLILLPLLPALYIPALPENLFAERYVYFPSFGFALLLASVFTEIWNDKKNMAIGVSIVIVVVTLLYSIGTITRNAVWKDDVSFYTDVLRKSPEVPRMHVNLGWTYYNMGRLDDALREYKIALRLKPNLAEPHNDIGLIYERQDLIQEAIREYKTALDLEPDYPAAHNNLGNAYISLNFVGEAINEYQAALRLSPRYTAAHYNLANAFANSGFLNEAISEYKAAIKLAPEEIDAHNNLGVAYLRLNRFDKAVEEFNIVLRLNPHHILARQNLERALSGGL